MYLIKREELPSATGKINGVNDNSPDILINRKIHGEKSKRYIQPFQIGRFNPFFLSVYDAKETEKILAMF